MAGTMKTFIQTCVVLLLASYVQDAACLEGCDTGVDMVFVVDTSRSMTRREFDLQMEFVLEMTNDFKVSPTDTRVSVVQYAHFVYKLFCFDEFMDNIALMRAIRLKHMYFRGSTKTSKAFKYLRKRIFTSSCGMRENSKKIVILLTDGMPNNPAKAVKEAKKLIEHSTGVDIVTIGIGNDIERDMLYSLASSKDSVFNSTTFFDLEIIRPNVAMETCKKINPELESVMKGCHVGVDLAFLVDHSRSISRDDHVLQMDFVETMSRNFMVSKEDFHTRVAVIQFAHTVYNHFCFHEFLTNVELSLAINHTIAYPEGSTNLAKALKFTRKKLFNLDCGSRDDSFKVVVIVTDGKANYPWDTVREANLLKDAGVKVVTVGVGEIDERVLHPIASSHDMTFDNVHEVSLEKITAHVSSGACEIALNHNHTWTVEDLEFINEHHEHNEVVNNHHHSHHHRHAMLHPLVDLGDDQYKFADLREPMI